jgi:subtilisin family serine protease
MKIFKVTGFIFISLLYFSAAQAQEYFYYYKGKKQALQLNPEYIYVLTSTETADSARLKAVLGNAGSVARFSRDHTAQTLKALSQSGTEYWSEVRLGSKLSAAEYLSYAKRLQESGAIKFASPYFSTRDEKKIGLSQYFYVKLKSEKDFALLEKTARELNTVIVGQNKFMPLWYTLKCTRQSPYNALETANRFYESGSFTYAEPDLMIENEVNGANDPNYVNQWGLNNTGQYGGTFGTDVNALGAWDITKGSRDVIVAVLDHGFEMNHPDLQGNTFGSGFNTETGTSPAAVLGNHGTACAGIIGAVQDNNTGVSGIAPNAYLMSVSNNLLLSPTASQRLADGINWAWQNGADIISNSWGHSSLASVLLDDAINDALTLGRGGLGTIIVFAAGNSNGPIIYPASSNPDIIAVGAMSQCGQRKSPTSCDGENWWGSCFGTQLDVVAPGVQISTTDRQGTAGYTGTDYTATFNGTSSACPMVAGVAALILSVNPCLNHDQVENIIEQSAQKVGGYAYAATGGRPNGTWHTEMGYGLVDAQAAVQLAQSLLPTGPAFDLYTRDRPFDTGLQPNPDAGPMWISEEIWVRKNPDGGVTHQNPEYKLYSPNAVYIKVTNRSSVPSSCANLAVYFTKASTGLVWPIHWSNYFQNTSAGSILHGDLINTISIPSIAPGASYTAEVLWYPPNPANFDNDIHHFCLLSRIVSPADPMFNEQNMVGVDGNVRRNNNIAWKNVSVYNANLADDAVSVFVRGVEKGESKINLRFFDAGFQEKLRTKFFERGGVIYATVDEKFMERIKQARLSEVKIIDDKTLEIASAKSQIMYLPISQRETFSFNLRFRVELTQGEETILDMVQENAETKLFEGGERFVIRNAAKGKEGLPGTSSTIAKESTLVYPNPVNSSFAVNYTVYADASDVQIAVNSLDGVRQQVNLFAGKRNKGSYHDAFSVQHLKKGIYVLTLKIGSQVKTETFIIE